MGIPKIGWFSFGNILLKWMIWGYPYFRKPPFVASLETRNQGIPQTGGPQDGMGEGLLWDAEDLVVKDVGRLLLERH